MEIEFGFGEPYPQYEKVTPIEKEILQICPSCQGKLKSIPQRKTKCPHCSHFIFLKYSPSNPVRRLVNETENEIIEQEWNERARVQSLSNKLHEYKITLEELKDLNVDVNNDDEFFNAIILRYINNMEGLSNCGKLYYEIAQDLFPVVQEREQQFRNLSEDEQEDLEEKDYDYYFPYEDSEQNYWKVILKYLESLSRSYRQILALQKVDAAYYEILGPTGGPSFSQPMLTEKAIQSFNTLFSIKDKESLINFRPLLFLNEKNNSEILFPPLHLGCNGTVVISYHK